MYMCVYIYREQDERNGNVRYLRINQTKSIWTILGPFFGLLTERIKTSETRDEDKCDGVVVV
jgi:hypothetical protein